MNGMLKILNLCFPCFILVGSPLKPISISDEILFSLPLFFSMNTLEPHINKRTFSYCSPESVQHYNRGKENECATFFLRIFTPNKTLGGHFMFLKKNRFIFLYALFDQKINSFNLVVDIINSPYFFPNNAEALKLWQEGGHILISSPPMIDGNTEATWEVFSATKSIKIPVYLTTDPNGGTFIGFTKQQYENNKLLVSKMKNK